jgi:hypothetical protein
MGAGAAKMRLTAHLTVRQQPGHPGGTSAATRTDIVFFLTQRKLEWDGTFQQLSSWPFTVRVVFPDKSASTVALCPRVSPPASSCESPQREALDAGSTPVSGEVLGRFTLSKAQLASVVAGKGYVVIGTRMNPSGEIRGLLKKTPG